MKLFLAQTGDGSITMIIQSFDIERAISLANTEYLRKFDDESGFRFDEETVEELAPSNREAIIHIFRDETI